MAKKAARRDFTAAPILRNTLEATDQPIATSSMKTWYEVWRRNPDVRACVDIISRTAAKAWLKITLNEREYDSPETDALECSFEQKKNEIVLHAKVGGNAFVSILRNFEGNPVGVEVLDPRYVTIYTVDAVPVRYVYQDKLRQMRQFEYAAEDIIHWRPITDPDNPAYGVSTLESVIYDALGDDRAAMSNFSFFDNNAIPANIVKVKDGTTQETVDKLKEAMAMRYGGAKNQGRSTISTAIDSVLTVSDSNKDGKWLEMRRVSTEKICAALNVPKALLNYTDGVNYSTADVQYRTFIENTIRPIEHDLEEILERLFEPYGVEVEIVDDHIAQATEWSDIAIKLKSSGIITQDEAREYVGLDPMPMQPIQATAPLEAQTPPEPAPQGDATSDATMPPMDPNMDMNNSNQ